MTDKPWWPVFFDLETTGVNIDKANICQIAAVQGGPHPALGSMQPTTLFSTYVNPGMPIPQGAMDVHHITNDMVKNSISQHEALVRFAGLLEKMSETHKVILAGHNIERYDIPIIKRILPDTFGKYPTIDTYTGALRRFGDKDQKLGPLFKWYVLDNLKLVNVGDILEDAHDAAADCHMCAHILAKMLKDTGLDVRQYSESQRDSIVLDIWPFGKYQGKPCSQVPKGYMNWCRMNFTEPHKDVEATICQYLGCEA